MRMPEPRPTIDADDPGTPERGVLSEVERAMLDLEGGTWRVPGLKEQAIKDRFAMTSTRYYQRLNGLLSRREAWEYAPTTVSRLRRVRASHARSKTVRQSA